MGWCHRVRRERDFWSRGKHGAGSGTRSRKERKGKDE